MRFFSPELYLRFNAADEVEADAADAAWESAISDYRSHLEGIRSRMSSQVWKLANLCMHDAELLGFEEVVEPANSLPVEVFGTFPFWSAMGVVSVRREDEILSIIYVLSDRVREQSPAPDWPFSKQRVHWLYDEVDMLTGDRGIFVHRVLLSDGRVLEIPFMSVFTHRVLLSKARANGYGKGKRVSRSR